MGGLRVRSPMKDECEVLVTRVSSTFTWGPFQVKSGDMEMCVSNFPRFLYK